MWWWWRDRNGVDGGCGPARLRRYWVGNEFRRISLLGIASQILRPVVSFLPTNAPSSSSTSRQLRPTLGRTTMRRPTNSRRLPKRTRSYRTRRSANSTTPTATRASTRTRASAEALAATPSAADSAASRDQTDPSTSRRRAAGRRSMRRNCSRRSSAWAAGAARDAPVAIEGRGRAPTYRCQYRSRSRRRSRA